MTLYNIYSKFSSAKMQERIMLIGRGDDIERLYDVFPKKCLPEDMGGEIPESNRQKWVKRLEAVAPQVSLPLTLSDLK